MKILPGGWLYIGLDKTTVWQTYSRTAELDCPSEVPGLSLPIGLADNGMPIGLQLHTRPGTATAIECLLYFPYAVQNPWEETRESQAFRSQRLCHTSEHLMIASDMLMLMWMYQGMTARCYLWGERWRKFCQKLHHRQKGQLALDRRQGWFWKKIGHPMHYPTSNKERQPDKLLSVWVHTPSTWILLRIWIRNERNCSSLQSV